MMNLFDTHAHLMDEAYDEDREQAQKEAAEELALVINIGCDVQTSVAALDLANKYENFYAGVGIHPEEALKFNPDSLKEIAELAKNTKNVAIGEIGLDYHWDVPKSVQKEAFEAQIALARELKLPLIIHDREAHRDTLDMLSACKAAEVGGVMHAYSGSAEMVREVLDVMLDLAKQGRTMIIVTHEMQFARAIADRVIFLDGGKIIEESTPEAFFDHPKTERAQKFLRTFTFDSVK